MASIKEFEKMAYVKMTPKLEFYEENKPLTRIEYVIRRRKFDFLISIIGKISGKLVLILGCGGGMESEWLSISGGKIIGIDISSQIIRIAKRRFKKKKLKGSFVVGDMENLPFKLNSFDIIIAYDALHHSENVHTCLLEAYRTTRHIMGVIEPNITCLTRKISSIFFKKYLMETFGTLTKAYSMTFYINQFKQAGFKIVKYIFCNIIPPEVYDPLFKISYGVFGDFLSLLVPKLDKIFEILFPFSCSSCIIVSKKIGGSI